jgi:branched-chain amino acid transport system permease protein
LTDFLVHTAITIGIFGLVALSLNLQYGLTGLLNFGQIGLFGAGAFAVAIGHRHGWPIAIAFVLAPLSAAALGGLMTVPARRLKQEYWSLLTLGVSEIFLAVMDNEDALAGGVAGTRGIPRVVPNAFLMLGIVGAAVGLVLVAFERIQRSQLGRVLRTIREDETMTATLGRDVFGYQLRVMLIGGSVAGLAGAFYAHYISYVDTKPFDFTETFLIWTMLIVGGVGSNYGALFGAVLLQGLFVGTRFFPDAIPLSLESFALLRSILIGGCLVAFIMFRPSGTFPERRRRYRARR